MILCKGGSCTGVQIVHIKFTLSAILYSADDCNAKVKVTERKDWETPQIKDPELVIPKHFTLMASNKLFIMLLILSY